MYEWYRIFACFSTQMFNVLPIISYSNNLRVIHKWLLLCHFVLLVQQQGTFHFFTNSSGVPMTTLLNLNFRSASERQGQLTGVVGNVTLTPYFSSLLYNTTLELCQPLRGAVGSKLLFPLYIDDSYFSFMA